MVKTEHVLSLPGPWEIAKEAWTLFRNRFWSLAKVFGLNMLLGAGILLLGAIIFALLFFGSGNTLPVMGSIVVGIILFCVFIYISIWMQASYLLVLSGNKDTVKIKEVLKDARSFVLPLLLTSLLTTFLVLGGIFLFLIPGLVLSIWFSLQQYVVLFEKKSHLLALHSSREYLRGRFFSVLWRMIAVYLPVIILGIIFAPSPQQGEPSNNSIFQFISFVAQPFYLAYGVVLYQHVVKTSDQKITNVPSNAKNMYFWVAGLGYLLLVLGIIFILPRG